MAVFVQTEGETKRVAGQPKFYNPQEDELSASDITEGQIISEENPSGGSDNDVWFKVKK